MELWAGVEVRKQKLVWLEGEVDRMRVHAVVRTSSSSCFAVLSMTSLLVPDTARSRRSSFSLHALLSTLHLVVSTQLL